jgi:sporulation protein YlmC with PRC-barrel domain
MGQNARPVVPATSTATAVAQSAPDLAQGVYLASIDAEDRSLRRYAGFRLLNTESAELGTVRDFIVHPSSSRVRYAVISSGGVLGGIGNSLRLVPVEALRRGQEPKTFAIDILQSAWLQTPPISDDDYVADRFAISAEQHQTLTQRFAAANPSGSRPMTARVTTNTAPNAETDRLIRASALRGKKVTAGDRHVGNVENIILDLEQGTAAALLDASGEFTGTTGKYLVPLSRLAITAPPQNMVSTVLTRADFDRAQPSNFGLSSDPRSEPGLSPTGRSSAEPQPMRR